MSSAGNGEMLSCATSLTGPAPVPNTPEPLLATKCELPAQGGSNAVPDHTTRFTHESRNSTEAAESKCHSTMIAESAPSGEKANLGEAELGNDDSENDMADKSLSFASLLDEESNNLTYSWASAPAVDFSRLHIEDNSQANPTANRMWNVESRTQRAWLLLHNRQHNREGRSGVRRWLGGAGDPYPRRNRRFSESGSGTAEASVNSGEETAEELR
ncbi:uncharacterized protein B0T15DRAFT_56933 [Chaetomium strumarium]|uniref:Uncharacterized protein n=1 Tax=Chaetomium strumarium TaxID=1170767 RepID=A0AAJ0M6J5_9PEZI|nr:hypothetical protein B0T15DRAFT_56933 [Chaetomium strumarium]